MARRSWGWLGRSQTWLVLAALWPMGALAAAEPPAPMPAAHWEGPGLQFEVRMATPASLNATARLALTHYAVGVAAMPLAELNSELALAWPLYVLIGAPLQARFNAQVQAIDPALTAEPLIEAVAAAGSVGNELIMPTLRRHPLP